MRYERRKGQAVVEMAVLFPFFLLVIVGGIIDFGYALNNLITLQQIANEAAQYAAEGNAGQPEPTSTVTAFAQTRKPAWWANIPLTVTVNDKTTIDAGAKPLKEVIVMLDSPVYTPFYQSMIHAATGSPSIRLSCMAAFQVP
ncbi:MAG: pilus assembly protein [Candidatus Riflebacteria bacterium]|nr:pilus assembly protein [Candidatus Riflebacteria bacterium]